MFTTRALRLWLAGGAAGLFVVALTLPLGAQNRGRDVDPRFRDQRDVPSLSASTAILESAVRDLYKEIEPASDNSQNNPNELLAYADLRALRLYTGALEVAGWSLEQVWDEYMRFYDSGVYRNGRNRISDPQALAAMEQFMAYRETVRTLLYRVRQTAVAVEHQLSFCDPNIERQYYREVTPALEDTIRATNPMLQDQITTYRGYGTAGQNVSSIIQTGANGMPTNAVEVTRSASYRPFEGQGYGGGRYVEVRAFGGPVRVRSVHLVVHERAFGGANSIDRDRDIQVNQVVNPGQPYFLEINRGRWADISDLEVNWEPADRSSRRIYATLDVVEDNAARR